jgi:hypothetical protein
MLALEVERHNAVLGQFIYDISPLNPSSKSLKENKLSRLLLRAFIKKRTELTSEILDELSQMAD